MARWFVRVRRQVMYRLIMKSRTAWHKKSLTIRSRRMVKSRNVNCLPGTLVKMTTSGLSMTKNGWRGKRKGIDKKHQCCKEGRATAEEALHVIRCLRSSFQQNSFNVVTHRFHHRSHRSLTTLVKSQFKSNRIAHAAHTQPIFNFVFKTKKL